MSKEECTSVIFSNRAYNAIIRESFHKDPIETGGILLGYVIDEDWIVMEILPPGIHSIFKYAYFEYDQEFVNYLADSVANQYQMPLTLLGLWHRHPGSMDSFSTTDDGTNISFAKQNECGVISGLVNIDPKFRLTMFHLSNNDIFPDSRPRYRKVEVLVGDDYIPEELFVLRYIDVTNPIRNTSRHEKENKFDAMEALNKKHTKSSRKSYKLLTNFCTGLKRHWEFISLFLLGLVAIWELCSLKEIERDINKKEDVSKDILHFGDSGDNDSLDSLKSEQIVDPKI